MYFICVNVAKKWALLNHETAEHRKHRNTETPKQLFFPTFFILNTEIHKETNSAVEKFVASAKRVSSNGCLDVQAIH